MEFRRVKIIACEPHDNYKVWICFDDGISGEIDLSYLVGKGVFAAWNSLDFFRSVHIDERTKTLAWGNEIDLDVYVLHEKIIHSKETNE